MGSKVARSIWRQSTRIWVLLAALSAFLVASIGGLAAAVSAGIAGAVVWWLIIERPSKPTVRRGALFGSLTVLLAHALIYLVAGLLGLPIIGDRPVVLPISGPVPSPAELSEILYQAASVASFTLFFGGIITIPLGIVAGLLLVIIRERFPIQSKSQVAETEALDND